MEYVDYSPVDMVIVDIDGTLADPSMRYPQLKKDGDVKAFHNAFRNDLPTRHAPHIWRFIERLPSSYELFIVSLRYEELMMPTIGWLAKNISGKFKNYLSKHGPDPKHTFIMGTKDCDKGNPLRARVRQVRECFLIRSEMAEAQGRPDGDAIMFEDDPHNAYAISMEFKSDIVIFQPYHANDTCLIGS